MMKSSLCIGTIVLLVAVAAPVWTQQTFTGKLSDSSCGASHASKAGRSDLTDRQCLLACVKKLSKYVLVSETESS